jgi:hypothetical protein
LKGSVHIWIFFSGIFLSMNEVTTIFNICYKLFKTWFRGNLSFLPRVLFLDRSTLFNDKLHIYLYFQKLSLTYPNQHLDTF